MLIKYKVRKNSRRYVYTTVTLSRVEPLYTDTDTDTGEALPGVLGIQGEGLFIFRDLGRMVIYFQGFGEKAWF